MFQCILTAVLSAGRTVNTFTIQSPQCFYLLQLRQISLCDIEPLELLHARFKYTDSVIARFGLGDNH